MKSISASIIALAGAVCMGGAAATARHGAGEVMFVLCTGALVGLVGLAAWGFAFVSEDNAPKR